jgi:hypothetical protein
LDGAVSELLKNLYLFNFINYGIPVNTVETRYATFKNGDFQLELVSKILGYGDKTKEIHEFFPLIDKSTIFSYALVLS